MVAPALPSSPCRIGLTKPCRAGRRHKPMTLCRKGNQLIDPWRAWLTVDPYRRGNVDRQRNQILRDEATKVLLIVMPNIALQPRCALLHQVGPQGDSLGGNRFDHP